MDDIAEKLLKKATEERRFKEIENHRLEIWTCLKEGTNEIKIISSGLQPLDTIYDWLVKLKVQDSDEVKAVLPNFTPPEGYVIKGGLRLLVQLQRPPHNIGQPDTLPWINASTFRDVSNALDLPTMYVPTMDHSSGLAEFVYYPGFRKKKPKFYFVAQNTDYHRDSWSLALSYDPQECITTGFFCAEEATKKELHEAPEAIIDKLIASQHLSIHPMLLPTIMFRKLMDSSVKHRDNLRKNIQDLEDKIGYVEGRGKKEQDRIDAQLDHRLLSRGLNNCKKHQASRDGRHQFWRQFKTVLVKSFLQVQLITNHERQPYIEEAHHELKHLTSFNIKIFESLDGRDVNYSERIEAQLALLYSLIAQEESKYQADIAKAAAKDSAEIKSLTILGFVFLPANLVAALFGVQQYQVTWHIIWIYVVWTIPAVLCVFFLVYLIRMMKKEGKAPHVLHSRNGSGNGSEMDILHRRRSSAPSHVV